MRIGLVIYGDLDTVSGGYLYDRMLVAHLRVAGDSVEVISLPWRSYSQHLTDNFASALHRRLRGGAWDVLLQDELNHPSLFLVNRRLGRVRAGAPHPYSPCPIIAIVHHLRCSEARPAWQNRLYRWVERRYLWGVRRLHLQQPHDTGRGDGPDRGRPAERGRTSGPRSSACHCHSRGRSRPRVAEPGPLRVLFIGNLIPRKGLHTVLDALAQAPSGARLTVAGDADVDPAYAVTIRAQIARLGLAGCVELLGAASDEALARLLAESQVLAVPSSYEGYGIVYAEALGHGLPVIASTAGAAHEIVADGQEGFLVAPGDAAAIAAILGRLSGDRAALARMSQAALARYATLPTWAESAAQARGFLSSIIR